MPRISNHNATMYRNLDLQLIRTFSVVAHHGSMTVAANVLSQTQGAVSQQIKRLEAILDCALFIRGQRSLRLTASGDRLQGHARRLIELNDAVWHDMAQSTAAGKVRLGVPYDLVGTCIAPVLRSYGTLHPMVEIGLTCAASPDLLIALRNGEIDLAIVEEPVGPSAGECLSVQRLVWVGAKEGNAHLKQPLPISIVSDTCAFRPALLDALAVHGRDWRAVFENGNLEATTATVSADLTVGAWLAGTVPADLHILSASDGLPPLPSYAINLYLPSHALPVAVQRFAKHMRDTLTRAWPSTIAR
ncbi:LysR substrate-binding domain-containing protein [Robbsia sp. KACC 23696]|uniref:LysR family transcriptional regulator n=1 Tax=Robbsia sp. KACC 23696 TaxID=3149231 RepID=UPI00325BC612